MTTPIEEKNRLRRALGLPPLEEPAPTPAPTPEPEGGLTGNNLRRALGLNEIATPAPTPAVVAPTPPTSSAPIESGRFVGTSPSPLGETGAGVSPPPAPVEPDVDPSIDPPSDPGLFQRMGDTFQGNLRSAANYLAGEVPRSLEIIGEPFQAVTQAARRVAPGPLGFGTNPRLYEQETPLAGGYSGLVEAEQQEHPVDQIVGGVITDPTTLVGGGALARQAPRAIKAGLGQGAERLLRATSQVAEAAPLTPEAKLTEAIKVAPKLRKETEAMRSQELRRRVGAASSIMERSTDYRQSARTTRGVLRGALPTAKGFEAVEPKMEPGEVKYLFDKIWTSEKQYFQKQNTNDALEKVMIGELPQRGEIKLLEDMFGSDLAKSLLAKRPWETKGGELALDALNLPRALKTAYDMSAPLRQGALLGARRPVEWAKNFAPMMKSFAKEDLAQQIDLDLRQMPDFQLWQDAGGYHGDLFGVGSGLAQREEAYMSGLARYIPGVRHSERGYVTFLNKMRFDYFKAQLDDWRKAGKLPAADHPMLQYAEGGPMEILTPQQQKNVRDLAYATNIMSGRGDLGRVEDLAPILNFGFFSPRLQMSRIQTPLLLLRSSNAVRKVVARTLVQGFGGGAAVLTGLKLGGVADVEIDPRSSDFGRVRVGPSRVDFWAGYQPYARLVAQLSTQRQKATGSGNISHKPWRDTVLRFLWTKAAPVPGAAIEAVVGENILGEEFGGEGELFGKTMHPAIRAAYDNLAPLFLQDMAEAIDEAGLSGGFMAAPSFFGTSAVTYRTVEDIANETYTFPDGRPASFGDLYPHQQTDVRQAFEFEQPPGRAPTRFDELDEQEDETLSELNRIAPQVLRYRNIRVPKGQRNPFYEMLEQYYKLEAEMANRRDEAWISVQGGTTAASEQYEGAAVRNVAGTEQEKAALEEYHGVSDQATVNGVFHQGRYDDLMQQYERKWQREGTLLYVRAATNTTDWVKYPQLFRMLSDKSQARWKASQQARQTLNNHFREKERR